ncbi:MAG: hypothetical protein ABEJ05_01705 [Haloglomus sp.]
MSSSQQRATTVGFDRAHDATALGLGALFAALVAISLWAALVARAAQFVVRPGASPGSILLVSGAASLVGLAGGALLFARYRDIDLSLGRPQPGALRSALGTVVAPAALVVGTALVADAAFGVTLRSLTNRFVSPDASLRFLLWTMGLPAAFLGVGYGVLFCALVTERVRALVGGEDTVAVAALLAGFFWLLPIDAAGTLRLSIGSAVELTASLVFGVAFAMALGILHQRVESSADGAAGFDASALARRHLLVLAVAAVGLFGAATGLTNIGEVVVDGLWVTAFTVGALGYERTRSVWVPSLAMAGFNLALGAVVYAEAVLGITGGI